MKCGSSEELVILKWVAKQAIEVTQAKKVYLFGSRARGDAREVSDFDLAIDTSHPDKLAVLQGVLEENPLTLLAFDVVDLTQVDPNFRNRILAEAIDITSI